MDNTGTAASAGAELTCALGCRAGRVYVGAADGSVRAVAANASTRDDESGRAGAVGHGVGKDLLPAHASWMLRVCAQAVTVCVSVLARSLRVAAE
jgi:hypothetical protein